VSISYKSNKGIRLTKQYFVTPPPTGQKVGGQTNFWLAPLAKLSPPHFQNRGAAPESSKRTNELMRPKTLRRWLSVRQGKDWTAMRITFTYRTEYITAARVCTKYIVRGHSMTPFDRQHTSFLPCAALSWGQPTWQGLGFSGPVYEETHPCWSNFIQSIFEKVQVSASTMSRSKLFHLSTTRFETKIFPNHRVKSTNLQIFLLWPRKSLSLPSSLNRTLMFRLSLCNR